ncbi:MAG: hypothetical protein OEW27_12000 [Aquincola sp.]|nr:hypothetical protein [Aquincola sp.]MDH5330661.1 hypothetical protein [Aquincola sp.]
MKHTRSTSSSGRSSERPILALAMAAGVLLAVGLVALSVPVSQASREDVRLDSAPAVQPQHVAQASALDEGVNWAKVEASADPAPLAVAAYE